MRNPRLKKLKDRLNKHQQLKRRERMHARGTWRNNMERQMAQIQGVTIQAFQGVGNNMNRDRKLLYVALGSNAAAWGVIIARLLGWF